MATYAAVVYGALMPHKHKDWGRFPASGTKINHMNNNFFDLLAVEARTTDVSSSRAIYYGLCRKILRELVTFGQIELPDFGTFKVRKHGARRIKNVNTGNYEITRNSTTVKFIPDRRMRLYVDKKLGD